MRKLILILPLLILLAYCKKDNPVAPGDNYGRLSVGTSPTDAEIYLNNVYAGNSPLLIEKYLVGKYNILIKNTVILTEYYDIIDSITINKDQTTALIFDMTAKPVIHDYGVCRNISEGYIYGRATTFSNVNSLFYFFDFNGTNLDNWQIKDKWFINGDPYFESESGDTYESGSLSWYYVGYDIYPTPLESGNYKIEIYVKENIYEYLMLTIYFTVTQ